MAIAAVDHEDGRVLDGVVRRDRVRVRGHAFAHDHVVVQAARDGAHEVALGHDPGEPPILQHQDRTDVAVSHPLGHRDDRRRGVDGQQVIRMCW